MSISVISSKRRYLAALPAASGSQSAIFNLNWKFDLFSWNHVKNSRSLLTWLWSEFSWRSGWFYTRGGYLAPREAKSYGANLEVRNSGRKSSQSLIYSLPAWTFWLMHSKLAYHIRPENYHFSVFFLCMNHKRRNYPRNSYFFDSEQVFLGLSWIMIKNSFK